MVNRNIKILLIDDNRDNLISLKVLINEAFPEINVLLAINGEVGIKIAKEEDPDVIILDIVMPNIDGFEVCRRLKADVLLKDIPIIFLTAIRIGKESRIEAVKCGAEAFLSKPIDNIELTTQISAMLKIKAANIHKREENDRLKVLVKERTKSLIESEEKFRRIAENMSDVVWTADLNLDITYVTPSIFRLLEITPEEHINQEIEDIFTLESINLIRSILSQELLNEQNPDVDKNRTRKVEVKLIKKDKTTIWCSIHISFIRDKEGCAIGLQGVTRDITNRKITELELIRTKDYLEKLFNYANSPIVVWDEKLVIIKVNSAFEHLTGRKSESVIGKNLNIIFPTSKLTCNLEIINNFKENKFKNSVEIDIIHSDGGIRTVLWSLATIQDNEKNQFSTIAHGQDITDRIVAEKKLLYLSYHDQLTGLYNRRFFDEHKERLDIEDQLPLSIIIGDINGLKLINDAFGHAEGDKLLIEAANIMKSYCRNSDILARTGGDEFSILLPRTEWKTALAVLQRIKDECDLKSIMLSNERLHISISLGCGIKRTANEEFKQAIITAEEYMYQHKLLEHNSSHSAIVSSIKATMFEKSHETEEHAERLVDISKKVGVALNLSQLELNELELFATLHDIGKVGIKDEILNKPDKLSKEEWVEMKKHPMIGYRIATSALELSQIANYILNHHERWDGKGYPQGISGANIPLLSRIVAVVDAYDAMTQDRPYRKAMTKEKALLELEKNSGTQFDPNIVNVLTKILSNDDSN